MNSIKRISIVVFLFILTACGGETAPIPPRGQAVSPNDLDRSVAQNVSPTATLPPLVLSEQVVAETATVAAVVENEVVVGETAVSPTTVPPTPTAEPEPTVSLVQSGRTEEGGYFLGNPDAPITFIDYSDFM